MNDLRGEAKALARRTALTGVGLLVSFLVAPLPPSWRGWAERRWGLDVDRVAIPSGLIQFGLAFLVAILGYVAWFHALSTSLDAVADRLGVTGSLDPESYKMIGAASLWMNPLLPLIYVITTPIGFVSALGMLGGSIRAIGGAATGENMPDPTLALLDWLRRTLFSRWLKHRRDQSKGPTTPDCIELGVRANDGFDLRITSTWEFDWRPGNTIVVAGEPLILISKDEIRDARARLRLRYDLRKLGVGEIIRAPKAYVPSQAPEIRTVAAG